MKMMAKIWALASLLLVILRSGIGTTHPGLVVRITQKGLDYANYYGMIILQRELSNIKLQDFHGNFKVRFFGKVNYNFYRLINKEIHFGDSYLGLFPGEGIKASISNSAVIIRGHWKLEKLFITLLGTFDLNVRQISISVTLRLDSDNSGKPIVIINQCESHIGHVGIRISGDLGWLLNLFQDRIGSWLSSTLEEEKDFESQFKKILNLLKNQNTNPQKYLQEELCGLVRSSVTSYLQPYLQTLQVIVKVDEISSLDYSLLGPPQITLQNLDVMFKGKFFSNTHYSPVPFDAPPMNLPQENNHMVYFGISDYLFNTGSMVYLEAGVMNFSITDDMILTDFGMHLNTKLFKNLIPKLATTYPNMRMEFQVFPAAFPILTFSPGNVTVMPKLHVEAFIILPSALPKSVFWFSVTTNVSFTVMLTSGRITGSIHSRSQLAVELKHSEIGQFDGILPFKCGCSFQRNINFDHILHKYLEVVRIEKILNFLTATLFIPTVNEKFQTGFPLPLPKDIYFYDLILQPHKEPTSSKQK